MSEVEKIVASPHESYARANPRRTQHRDLETLRSRKFQHRVQQGIAARAPYKELYKRPNIIQPKMDNWTWLKDPDLHYRMNRKSYDNFFKTGLGYATQGLFTLAAGKTAGNYAKTTAENAFDALNAWDQGKPINWRKLGRKQAVATGTGIIQALDINPIKTIKEIGSKSNYFQRVVAPYAQRRDPAVDRYIEYQKDAAAEDALLQMEFDALRAEIDALPPPMDSPVFSTPRRELPMPPPPTRIPRVPDSVFIDPSTGRQVNTTESSSTSHYGNFRTESGRYVDVEDDPRSILGRLKGLLTGETPSQPYEDKQYLYIPPEDEVLPWSPDIEQKIRDAETAYWRPRLEEVGLGPPGLDWELANTNFSPEKPTFALWRRKTPIMTRRATREQRELANLLQGGREF